MIREYTDSDYDKLNKYYKARDNSSINIKDNPFQYIYVYEIDNEIVAFIDFSVIYDRCELNYIYVFEDYRGLGIASELLNFLFNKIKKQCQNITLEVNENNLIAKKLYKNNKFKKVAIRKQYYGKDDAIMMMREMNVDE